MVASFRIWASADAQILSRLLEFFAQRDLIASHVTAVCNDAEMTVHISIRDLSPFAAEVIAEKMRQNVLVTHVTLNEAM
jgi:hypothetical protein